jgi:hypothetical protein
MVHLIGDAGPLAAVPGPGRLSRIIKLGTG